MYQNNYYQQNNNEERRDRPQYRNQKRSKDYVYLFSKKIEGLTEEEKEKIYSIVDSAVDAIFLRFKGVKEQNLTPYREIPQQTKTRYQPSTQNIWVEDEIDFVILHVPDRDGKMMKLKIDSSFFTLEEE